MKAKTGFSVWDGIGLVVVGFVATWAWVSLDTWLAGLGVGVG